MYKVNVQYSNLRFDKLPILYTYIKSNACSKNKIHLILKKYKNVCYLQIFAKGVKMYDFTKLFRIFLIIF